MNTIMKLYRTGFIIIILIKIIIVVLDFYSISY